MNILSFFILWIVISGVLAYYTSWWFGLLLALAFPLVAFQWSKFVWKKMQILSILDTEYDYDLRGLPVDSPQASTLNAMLRSFRQSNYMYEDKSLNKYDMATMFMAVMVNSLTDGEEGKPIEEKQVFAKGVRDHARRLDAEGHISVKESIELIEEATTVKFGLC